MYSNVEIKYDKNGDKTVRKVNIADGRGYKSITHYKGGKRHTVRKSINKSHIKLIKNGKFVPGLFADCCCKRKTHKNNHM